MVRVRRLYYAGRVMFFLLRFVYRFVGGRNLFTPRRTDATFLTSATRQLDQNAPALHRWEMMRGASRLAWRLAGGYLLLFSVLLILLRLAETIHPLPAGLRPGFLLLAHLSLAAVVIVSVFARHRIREYGCTFSVPARDEETREIGWRTVEIEGRRAWLQEKVLPISRSASVILGHSIPDRSADQWVTVPKDYREPGRAVEIRLPAHFTGADANVKARLERSVAAKLGITNISADWQTQGSAPRVLLSSPPEPPGMIRFSDVERFLHAQGEWDFLYGLTGTGESFSVSITGDTPHGAVSAGSGGGKSELLKGKIAQAGHKGWFTIVMDWKEESQTWARGLDGVRYVVDIEAIHDMCVSIGEEIEWRKAHPDMSRPRVLIIAEEWSITAPLLSEYWAMLRSTAGQDEKRTMPLRSPAISSVMKLIFTGRALGMFLEFVAIRFSARVTNGNADLRESFQVIHMARYKPQTVKMLAPDVKPFPRKSKILGRWVAVNGDEAVVYQAVLWSDEEATQWHQSGIEIPTSPWSPRFGPTRPTAAHVHSGQGTQLGDRLARPNSELPAIEGEIIDRVDARKLSQMVEGLAHLDVTLNILQHAAKKDDSFPGAFGGNQFKGYTYDFEAVKDWARRRYASQKVGR